MVLKKKKKFKWKLLPQGSHVSPRKKTQGLTYYLQCFPHEKICKRAPTSFQLPNVPTNDM